jgi:hypothetical protein
MTRCEKCVPTMILTGRHKAGPFFNLATSLGVVHIMKKILLTALLGVCTICVSPLAAAQQEKQGDTVTIPAPAPAQIASPSPARYMDAAEFGNYKGGYNLSNGQVLTLTQSRYGTKMYAEVDNLGAHQIVSTGKDTFVALDRKLQVRFDFDRVGDVGGELLMVVPGKNIAGVVEPDQLVRVAWR